MKLSDLKIGESAYILQVNGDEAFARRLSEIGFIRGEKIHNHMKAPLMDPVEYEIMGTTITLRRTETKDIEISLDPVEKVTCPAGLQTMMEEEGPAQEPNQQLSCGCQKESNECECKCETEHQHPEETNDLKKSKPRADITDAKVIDIDGVSQEELDAATPKFCKFCPEQDECEKKKGHVLSNLRFRKWNGQEMTVVIVGNPNCGKTTLFNHISGGHEKEGNYCGVTVDSKEGTFIHNGVKIHLVDLPGTYSLASYSPEEKYVEDYLNNHPIDVILNVLDANNLERNLYLTLQAQKVGVPMIGALNMYDELEKRGDTIDTEELGQRFGMKFMPTTSKYGKGLKELFDEVLALKGTTPKFLKHAEVLDTSNTGECFAFIQQSLEGIYKKSKSGKSKITSRIDDFVTNRWLGFIIFALIIYVTYGLTFGWVGNHFMDWIEEFFGWLGELVGNLLPDGWFKDLIVDGIIGGVGGVIVFLPNILILFICVSIMEESGYMSRAAFILDRIMRAFGLHGKSFIPMICGFGCNVPAIMSTRGIENRKNRLVTILVASLFSCSARIPVYNVLATAFFPNYVTPIIFSLYVVGIVLALVLAKLFSLFLVKEKEMNYLMELPEYRIPSVRNVLKHTWERGKQYLKKMGTVILAASIIIWFLSNFPRVQEGEDIDQNEKSCLGVIGKFVEPVFRPMGSNWQMDVGLLTGFGAKEVVVSTLNILYGGGDDDEEDAAAANLSDKLLKSGELNPRGAYAYMLFTLLYFPCVATIVAIGHEAGWKWAGFVSVYTTALAWLVATAFYQISGLF